MLKHFFINLMAKFAKAIYCNERVLMWAAERGYETLVDCLLDLKTNPNTTASDGVTPLFMAALSGHTTIVSRLLRAGANPNVVDNDGFSPLYLAANNGHTEIVNSLLGAHANVDVIVTLTGSTPLFAAAFNGYTVIVDYLLKNHANPNLALTCGATPLYTAVQNNHEEIVIRLLDDVRAEPNLAMLDGVTPFYLAAQKGLTKIVDCLLKVGVINVNAICNRSGNTALIEAARNGHKSTVERLLRVVGIDITIRNRRGNTAADIATTKGYLHIASLINTQSLLGSRVTRDFLFDQRLKAINCNQIPDMIVDPVSMEVMNDPITLSSGHTYDYSTVVSLSNGKPSFSDPLSRRKLITRDELNHATNWRLKNFIEEFVSQKEKEFSNVVSVASVKRMCGALSKV